MTYKGFVFGALLYLMVMVTIFAPPSGHSQEAPDGGYVDITNPRLLLSRAVTEMIVYESREPDAEQSLVRHRPELYWFAIGYQSRYACSASYNDLVKFIPWTLRQNPELLNELAPTLRQILDKRAPEDE